MRPCVCLSACALEQCLCVDHCADAWVRLRACAGARVPRTGVPDGAERRSPRCALSLSVCARARAASVYYCYHSMQFGLSSCREVRYVYL
eukprot:COSAG01_NODE_4130_length_5322_cov_102.139001_1_plen_90_part_00